MNDEYTHPFENVSSTEDYEEITEQDLHIQECPVCGSSRVSLVSIELEDHRLHDEFTCMNCGYTETN